MNRFRHSPAWLLVAAHLCAGEVSAAQLRSIAVDLTPLDEQSYERIHGVELEQRVIVRLVNEGFAVVAPTQSPDIVILIQTHAGGLRIISRAQGKDIARDVEMTDDATEEMHLEIAQKVAQIARATALERSPAPRTPAPLPLPAAAPCPDSRARPPVAAPAPLIVESDSWEPFVGIGAVVRNGAADPQAALGVRFGPAEGTGMVVSTGYLASSGARLDVREHAILGGFSYRASVSTQFELDVGASAGVRIHWYSASDEQLGDQSGSKVDGLATIPVSLLWKLHAWRLGATIGPTWSRGRRHVFEHEVLWERSAFAVESSLSARFRW